MKKKRLNGETSKGFGVLANAEITWRNIANDSEKSLQTFFFLCISLKFRKHVGAVLYHKHSPLALFNLIGTCQVSRMIAIIPSIK